jgi:hypothetical protein
VDARAEICELLCEPKGSTNIALGLARQAEEEIDIHREARLAAVAHGAHDRLEVINKVPDTFIRDRYAKQAATP